MLYLDSVANSLPALQHLRK